MFDLSDEKKEKISSWKPALISIIIIFTIFFCLNIYKESNKNSEIEALSNCYSWFTNPFDSWNYIARDWYNWIKEFHECDVVYDDLYLIEEYCEDEIENEECLENTKENLQHWCDIYENQRSKADICIQHYCDKYWGSSKEDIKNCKESLLFNLYYESF